MPKNNTKPAKTPRPLRGGRLKAFVHRAKHAIAQCDADPEHRQLATDKLDAVLHTVPVWEINHPITPSLPKYPGFTPQPGAGRSFSRIPIPPEHRHLFKGQRQHTKRWTGVGIAAWCHYLAGVENEVEYFKNPPEARRRPAPPTNDTSEALEQLKGRNNVHIQAMADLYFKSAKVARLSEEARRTIKGQWLIALGYLQRQGRVRVSQIDNNTLDAYRNFCARLIQKQKRSKKTTNDYLRTLRRILGFCRDYGRLDVPPYTDLLCNFTDKEVLALSKEAGHGMGARGFGKAEIIAMPAETIRAWLDVAEKDPFVYALTMCSLNLAAGAADLSDLVFDDTTLTNPLPCVDMKRKLFITKRHKTGVVRWTCLTKEGDFAIPMMKRTYRTLKEWLRHREKLIAELTERRSLTERVERAAKARHMKDKGDGNARIAEELGVSVKYVSEILRQPADRRELSRSLAERGYSLRDITEITGFSKGSVSSYIRDITASRPRMPRSNRYAIISPDRNRVFFVPDTGRPLVNSSTRNDYVRNVFNRTCAEAGIVREVDVLAGRVPPPAPGTFVLPKRNGHYVFRRTAATVAGMLGGVPERELQNFLGHRSPEETRKYVRNPPPDYKGGRVSHDYRLELHERRDPVAVIEEFLDACFSMRVRGTPQRP